MIHPTDPPALHAAARALGRLAARGLLDGAEIAAAFAAHPSPQRTRALHSAADAAEAHALRRAEAIRRLQAALAPALRAWRPAAVLLAIADAHAGPALTRREARAAAAAAAARMLRL